MNTSDTLAHVSHRPYPMPEGQWHFCQQWNDVLMIHREMSHQDLAPLIPSGLPLDSIGGQYYVSLVLFSVTGSRPFFLPSFPPVSDFHEVNLRTYITRDGKPGIYFLSVEAGKKLVARLLRTLTFLPYETASMDRPEDRFLTRNSDGKYDASIRYSSQPYLMEKSPLDIWITERYALYLQHKESLYRYDIHHKPWPLRRGVIKEAEINYRIGNLHFGNYLSEHVHFTESLDVVAWEKSKLE